MRRPSSDRGRRPVGRAAEHRARARAREIDDAAVATTGGTAATTATTKCGTSVAPVAEHGRESANPRYRGAARGALRPQNPRRRLCGRRRSAARRGRRRRRRTERRSGGWRVTMSREDAPEGAGAVLAGRLRTLGYSVRAVKRGVGDSNSSNTPVLRVDDEKLLSVDAERSIRRSPYRRERITEDGLLAGYRLIPADSDSEGHEAHER